MAAFDIYRPHMSRPAHTNAVAEFFHSIWTAIASWNDRRLTRKALTALSARQLDDIGLNRGDIDRITSGY